VGVAFVWLDRIVQDGALMKRLLFSFVLLIAACAPAQSYDYWPNPVSHTNSDDWLRVHHQEIKVLKPNVLVLVADNHADNARVTSFLKSVAVATAEGSRYHAYADKSAQPQVQYNIRYVVNLRDQATTPWPAIWPMKLKQDGKYHFIYSNLFTSKFAAAMGFHDPDHPESYIGLRELFERGLINEVWMVYPEIYNDPKITQPGVYETAAHMQRYDAEGKKIPGAFDNCWGIGCQENSERANASVTMRFTELNMDRGVGCFLHATDHMWEAGIARDNPEFDRESMRFFNRGLKTRGFPADSLYDGCPQQDTGKDGACWEYPNKHTIAPSTMTRNVPKFKIEWGQGCGSAHFPPNARFNYDYENDEPVLNSCEAYAQQNGQAGSDKTTSYTADKVAAYEKAFPDCGGGWQIYMRQNFPAYGSSAKNADGTPVKSWWPYLYY
jgi:hypothetical protein